MTKYGVIDAEMSVGGASVCAGRRARALHLEPGVVGEGGMEHRAQHAKLTVLPGDHTVKSEIRLKGNGVYAQVNLSCINKGDLYLCVEGSC